VIPHTHWEGAVFKTREEYLEMGLPNILKAMRLLREQPGFRFTLDQVAYVRPFLERYPSEEADFRRFLAEGRLQLAGALDVMPDDNMPGGETFVRQMQYGKGYYRDKLGIDVTTGWLLDTFGHHAQIPQLLVQGGYRSFWFFRGVPRQDHPSEFLWEGIDGTRIPAFWLPHSYGLLHGSPRSLPEFQAFVRQRFELLTPNSHGNDRVGLAGADMGACNILPRIIGVGRAAELLYTGRTMDGSEAERWGFYNKLCDRDAVLAEAHGLARSLADGPTFAHAMTKRCIHQEWNMGIDEAIEAEAQAQAICMQTKDYERAYEAFVGKRKPVFAGN